MEWALTILLVIVIVGACVFINDWIDMQNEDEHENEDNWRGQ